MIRVFHFDGEEDKITNSKSNFVFCRMTNSSKFFKVYQFIHYCSKKGIVNEYPDGNIRKEND